jgi:hypothetical protein
MMKSLLCSNLLILFISTLILINALSHKKSFDLSWEQLENRGDIPLGAAGASLVYLDDKLIVFGGSQDCVNLTNTGPNGTLECAGNLFFNDIYIYDLEENEWEKPEVNGDIPPARSFQRAVGYPDTNTMYVYGGVTYDSISGEFFVPYGDFWKFELDTLTWTLINDTNPPGIRVDPGLVISGHFIYLGFGLSSFGGPPEDNNRNDLWKYNILNDEWTLLIPNDPFNINQPSVRYQAKFDYNEDRNSILLYGGDVIPDNIRPLYDTWIFDIEDNEWRFRDNNSMIPLFAGISATYKDLFLLATGEERGGVQVQCIDPLTGRSSNPVNNHYALQFPLEGSTYYELHPNPSILPNIQAAYTLERKNLYVWGGFNSFCVRSGQQSGGDRRALLKFFDNVWKLELPSIED